MNLGAPVSKADQDLIPVWSAFGRSLNRWVCVKVQLVFPEIALLQIGAFGVVVSRGIDYINLPAHAAPTSLTEVERALSFEVWGWIFVAVGLLGLVGLHLDKWPVAAVAHGFGFALYLAFSAGSFIELFTQDDVYGWRTPVDWLFAALIHWLIADASIDGWKLENHTRGEIKEKTLG